MLKYKGSNYTMISMFVKKPMIRRYGKEQTKTWIRQGRGIYREMLSQVEDIGSDNPMAANIYMGFVFMAIWKAANGKITADDFRIVTREMMQNPLVRRIKGGVDMNKPEDLEKMKKMFHDMAAWQEAHPQYQEHSWDYHFDEEKHQDGIYYYFTRCPMEAYARKYGFMEILPVMCDLDYCIAETKHAVLYRDQTLASGGKICDYWFVGDQVKNLR